MNVRILSAAEYEFLDAVHYYNDECPGLGFEFAAEVQNTIDRIRNNPEAWAQLSSRIRRCLTQRFPFGVIYELAHDEVLIVSIMHMNRHPESWKRRL
jgi:plasmid stabilization system protein ParE